MKKKNIILLIILIMILVVVGFVAYKYQNYFSAFYHVVTNSSDKLEEKKLETDQRAIETIKEFGIETVRPLNEEEAAKLNSGELTEEDAVNIVLGRFDSETDNKPESNINQDNPSVNPSDNSTVSEDLNEKNAEIAQLIGKIYVLKAKFTSELDAVEQWVHSEYNKLTAEEKKSTSAKVKIGREAYSRALALEADCDSQIDDILNRLTLLLEETGQSTALVSEIRKAYENEKKVAISYYMDKI